MSYFFVFKIPQNADGSRVSYSPGWHGTLPLCPKDVTVLLYNDKEGYGIAQTPDIKLPKGLTALSEAEAKVILTEAKDEDGVYFGQKLANRWNPEVIIEDKPVEEASNEPAGEPIATKKAVFCPICHVFVMWLPENIVAKTIQLTCSSGHRVVLRG